MAAAAATDTTMSLFQMVATDVQNVFTTILSGAGSEAALGLSLLDGVNRLTALPVGDFQAQTTFSCIVLPYAAKSLVGGGPLAIAMVRILAWLFPPGMPAVPFIVENLRQAILYGMATEAQNVAMFLQSPRQPNWFPAQAQVPDAIILLRLLQCSWEQSDLLAVMNIINMLLANLASIPACDFAPLFQFFFSPYMLQASDALAKARELVVKIAQGYLSPERCAVFVAAWSPGTISPTDAQWRWVDLLTNIPPGSEPVVCGALSHRMQQDGDFHAFATQVLLPSIIARLNPASQAPFNALFDVKVQERRSAVQVISGNVPFNREKFLAALDAILQACQTWITTTRPSPSPDLTIIEQAICGQMEKKGLQPQFFNVLERHGFTRSTLRFDRLSDDFNVPALAEDINGYRDFLGLFFHSEDRGKLPVQMVQAVLQSHTFLKDLSGPRGNTLLYVAARYGPNYLDLLDFLLNQLGCDVNATSMATGSTPLHGAAFSGNIEAVRRLLRFNPDVLARNHAGDTPLEDVIKHNSDLNQQVKDEIALLINDFMTGKGQVAGTSWEFQDRTLVWRPFPAVAQTILAQGLAQHHNSVMLTDDHYSHVNLETFERVCGHDAGYAVRCRTVNVPKDRPVVFQIQSLKDGIWRDVQPASQETLVRACRANAAGTPLDKESSGLRMSVDLRTFNVTQEDVAFGFLRWLPAAQVQAEDGGKTADDNSGEEGESSGRIPQREQLVQPEPCAFTIPCPAGQPDPAWVMGLFHPVPVIVTPVEGQLAFVVAFNGLYRTDAAFQQAVDTGRTRLAQAMAGPATTTMSAAASAALEYVAPSPAAPVQPDTVSQDLELPNNSLFRDFYNCELNEMEKFVAEREHFAGYRAILRTPVGNSNVMILRVTGTRPQLELTKSVVLRLNYFIFQGESLKRSFLTGLSTDSRNSVAIMNKQFDCPLARQSVELRETCNVFLRSYEKQLSEMTAAHSEKLIDELRKFMLNYLLPRVVVAAGTVPVLAGELTTFCKNVREHCQKELLNSPFEHKALQDTWESLRKTVMTAGVEPSSCSILEAHLRAFLDRVPKKRCVHMWAKIPEIIVAGITQVEACRLNLPLYRRSRELLDLISRNDVVSVHTGTGTGKSTLLPPLLVAEQMYERVAVTQPRRLPCRNVCQRVLGTFSQKMAGWAVSGDEYKANRPILYLTDGLLREHLQSGMTMELDDPNQPFDFDVVILDEVHERGWNTDVCIALLVQMMMRVKEANRRAVQQHGPTAKQRVMKVILASATLDPAINKPFQTLATQGRLAFALFDFPMKCPYPINTHKKARASPVDLAIKLSNDKGRMDQILVFMATVAEVREAVSMFNAVTNTTSYGLYANQDPAQQRQAIKDGSVFFSTTIAETSLTFPHLRYVIDMGEINVLEFDETRRLSSLATVPATESTISQRRGRLGRTCPGDYYALYEDVPSRSKYPKPQILSVDLADIEFSLRQRDFSLRQLNEFLPSPPTEESLDDAISFLANLRLCDSHGRVPAEIKKLPILGGARMTASVIKGLKEGCGSDMLHLAAILQSLPSDPTAFIKAMPVKFKSEQDGDIMSLRNIMYELMRHKRQTVQEFDFKGYAKFANIQDAYVTILSRAAARLEKMENRLAHTHEWKFQAQQAKHNWEAVCKALLGGYSSNIFCSQQVLYGNKAMYSSYGLEQNATEQLGLLSFDSSLSRKPAEDPVPWILTLSVFFTPMQNDCVMLSLAGRFDPSWAEHKLVRHISFAPEEDALCDTFSKGHAALCTPVQGTKTLRFSGRLCDIAREEALFYQSLVHSEQVIIRDDGNANLKANLADLRKNHHIFQTLIWKYKNETQTDIKVRVNPDNIEFNITGRRRDCLEAAKGIRSFGYFLKETTVVTVFDSGNSPQRVDVDDATLQRLRMVTDSSRTKLDLWKMVRGPDATRETRMAAVAWIAVCDHDCRVEGGFVRDWVVRGDVQRPTPAVAPANWLEWDHGRGRWDMVKGVIPSDLDMELPFRYMPLDVFRSKLHKLGFTTEVQRFPQGYNLVIDRNAPTGPFTLDLIYPHNVATHDRVDFDVNNMFCLKDFTHDLGLRIDVSQSGLTLSDIVTNCKAKQFHVMKTFDPVGIMAQRVKKMVDRGWRQLENKPMVPNRGPKSGASYSAIASNDPLYIKVKAEFEKSLPGKTFVSMKLISAYNLDMIYKGIQFQIELENGGEASERLLFHATRSGDNVQSIMDKGFDDRYWNLQGLYGAGAYFADMASKSHDYTEPMGTHSPGTPRYMFWVKVLLGKEEVVTAHQPKRTAPSVGFHSVRAEYPSRPKEYIVYRYGQAKPFVLIQYTD